MFHLKLYKLSGTWEESNVDIKRLKGFWCISYLLMQNSIMDKCYVDHIRSAPSVSYLLDFCIYFFLITKHLNVIIFSLILRYVWNILFEIKTFFLSSVFRLLTADVFLSPIAPWLSRDLTSSLVWSFLSLWQ